MRYNKGQYIYADSDIDAVDDAKAWIKQQGFTSEQVRLTRCKKWGCLVVIWR